MSQKLRSESISTIPSRTQTVSGQIAAGDHVAFLSGVPVLVWFYSEEEGFVMAKGTNANVVFTPHGRF